MGVPIGINLWSRLVEQTFPYLDQVVEPFDSIWLPDHVQYNGHKVGEGWTLLSYALARYPDKLCGHDVLCNSFRNPAHLAKMAATAQALSGGRLVLGIGAGWNEEEYLAYGWEFPSARVRIEMLAEALRLVRAMWTESPASYEGKYYQIDSAYCEPRPEPIPPVMVGGAGEKYLLRVVAEQADWWNLVFRGMDYYAHKQEVLQEHCREVGRDYAEIKQVLHMGVMIGENENALHRMQERDDVRPMDDNTVAGTPEQVAEQLHSAVQQGAHRLTVHFSDAPNVDGTLLFAEQVLPELV